ncbi:MAG TPA: TfuA domain-containing protein, partial [Thermoanaerobaculia bacterium]|nr:TfuA domain-containing protein [Thermoanaerobaculia bacterium]
YYTVPAMSHKELLYALDAGVRVIGAASLGALRAVELTPWGMIGVGRVFEAYRDGELDGDDEVALLHAPAEFGYRPMTVALVEVREALRGIANGDELVAALKALPFMDRTPALVQSLAREILGEPGAETLRSGMARRSVKREDASLALALAAEMHEPAAPRRRTSTGYLISFQEAAARCPEGPSVLHAWNVAQVFHPEAAGFVREVRRRSLLAEAAERAGIQPDPAALKEAERRLLRWHEDLLGHPCMPGPEYAEEARLRVLAAASGPERLESLARSLDLEGQAALESLAAQPDRLPAWLLARAFSFTPAFAPAVAAAGAAEEVQRCFLRWSGGARVVREDLWRLAADLWGCTVEEVTAAGEERGLFSFYTLADGLRDALELVAAAERLPEPINDWPALRDRLRAAPDPAPGCGPAESSAGTRRSPAGPRP